MRLVISVYKISFFLTVFLVVNSTELFAQSDHESYVGESNIECKEMVAWRTGNIDTRFSMDETEFIEIINEAGEFWNETFNKKIIQQNNSGNVTINFIYDRGQDYSDKESELLNRIKYMRQNFYSKNLAFQLQSDRYQTEMNKLNDIQSEYNYYVDRYNTVLERVQNAGILSQTERDDLKKLKRSAESLNERLSEQNTEVKEKELLMDQLSRELNEIAEEVNGLIFEYREKFSSWRNFKKGVYMKVGIEQKINIYQFDNRQALKLLLIHEFGHALGFQHSTNPKSVMHYLKNEQNLTHLQLTQEDLDFLYNECNFSSEIVN